MSQSHSKTKYQIFANRLKEKRKEKGFSQEDFVNALNDDIEETTGSIGNYSVRSVSNWENAKQYPRDCIENICHVLGVTEEKLNTGTREEQYKYDEHFTRQIHQRNRTFCEKIGINNYFMQFIKAELPDEEFPVYTPIKTPPLLIPIDYLQETFVRLPLPEAYESDSQNEYQRLTADGKTVNLEYTDFVFIKYIQEEVISFIQFLCFKRRKEMEDIMQKIQDEYVMKDTDGTIFLKDVRSLEFKYDKYMQRTREVLENGKNNKKK